MKTYRQVIVIASLTLTLLTLTMVLFFQNEVQSNISMTQVANKTNDLEIESTFTINNSSSKTIVLSGVAFLEEVNGSRSIVYYKTASRSIGPNEKTILKFKEKRSNEIHKIMVHYVKENDIALRLRRFLKNLGLPKKLIFRVKDKYVTYMVGSAQSGSLGESNP
jgi:hypothetical protein